MRDAKKQMGDYGMITIKGNPVSDNHLYGHRAFGKRVIKYMTARGKEYKALCLSSIPEPFECVSVDLAVSIKIFFGDRRKRDIQGHLKALIDSFNGVIYKDDSQITVLYVTKEYDKENPRVEINWKSI